MGRNLATGIQCEVIHFGRKRTKSDYKSNLKRLQIFKVQKDFSVLVHESHIISMQVQQVIKKVNGTFALL